MYIHLGIRPAIELNIVFPVSPEHFQLKTGVVLVTKVYISLILLGLQYIHLMVIVLRASGLRNQSKTNIG